MTIDYNKLKVLINLPNLCHNFQVFRKRFDRVIPVIKSDAYGHGLAEVSRALNGEGVDTFAVGFVSEAVHLRQSGCDKRILALLGPVDESDVQALWQHRILTAISHKDQLSKVARAAQDNGPLDICLKFDTGMRRLGFRLESLPELIAFLKESKLTPVMATSHLVSADEPDSKMNVEAQAAKFRGMIAGLREAGYDVEANLANSAGSLAHELCHMDSLRLGIALYGGNPFHGTKWEDVGRELKPAMDVSAPVMQVHSLAKGEGISYGWTYTAERDSVVAIIGTGYADGYSRSLSNSGFMNIKGYRVPIRGRVCMQMTAVDVTELMSEGLGVVAGDEAFLLGGPGPGAISPEDLAGWWDTITYEVFCLLGMNRREYIR
ncbi:MAG: alanine racemase [Pseudodesulfovibrio sp.]|nr:alanine racemase [Pseudodesulfovibrio sp.]